MNKVLLAYVIIVITILLVVNLVRPYIYIP